VASAAQNGVNLQNGVQIVGGLLGMGGNAASITRTVGDARRAADTLGASAPSARFAGPKHIV
jgi:hypothetical protein